MGTDITPPKKTTAIKKRVSEMRIYRPRLDATTKKPVGAASNLDISVVIDNSQDVLKKRRKVLVFWTTAQQVESSGENAAFAWANENRLVRFKLEAVDIGEILSVLRGHKKSVGQKGDIYHQNSKGNSVLSLGVYEKDGKQLGYSFKMSSKRNGESKPTIVSHTLSFSEAIQVQTFLEEALKLMYNIKIT